MATQAMAQAQGARVIPYRVLVERAAYKRVKAFGLEQARKITLLGIANAEERDVPSEREFEVSVYRAMWGRD